VRQVDGFLNVSKPLGWTSHDVVGFVRRRIGQQRVGHAGTLDPAATGVLPLCLGRATRLAERVAAGSKLYAADVRFGQATDTCDAEGRVLPAEPAWVAAPERLDLDAITNALGNLLGTIEQVPPSYSALKVAGEAAYVRARRGEVVALASRLVTIYGLAVLAWAPPQLSLVVRCSTGTYVRALARDLGAALGCPAHLDALIRLAVGPFRLADALSLEALEQAVAARHWEQWVEPADTVTLDLPAAVLGAETARHFSYGRSWTAAGDSKPRDARAYDFTGRFLGLLRAGDAGNRWQPALSFVYDAAAENLC
jgi:tRNA pseudouridine55 synthase